MKRSLAFLIMLVITTMGLAQEEKETSNRAPDFTLPVTTAFIQFNTKTLSLEPVLKTQFEFSIAFRSTAVILRTLPSLKI